MGSADNVDADVCQKNWIHHNNFHTNANECVDVKEGSEKNLIENNKCGGQKDNESGCFGSRGNHNTFRHNDIKDCLGAGIRLGGRVKKGVQYGIKNDFYMNTIKDARRGGAKIQNKPQGLLCGNDISGDTPAHVSSSNVWWLLFSRLLFLFSSPSWHLFPEPWSNRRDPLPEPPTPTFCGACLKGHVARRVQPSLTRAKTSRAPIAQHPRLIFPTFFVEPSRCLI